MVHSVKGTALPLRAGCPTSYDTQANAPTACPEADVLLPPLRKCMRKPRLEILDFQQVDS